MAVKDRQKNVMDGETEANGQPHFYDISSLGGGLKRVARDKVNLTHAKAQEILDMPAMPWERQKRQAHIKKLHSAALRGTFEWDDVRIKTCSLDGVLYRANGQHTCSMRLLLPENYNAPVEIIRYKAETQHDMRQLYSSIDRNAPRTHTNVINAYLQDNPAFSDVKGYTLGYAAKGIAQWLWPGGQRKQHDADEVAYLMLTEYHKITHRICDFLGGYHMKQQQHIMRGPVVAAMYATFNKVPTKAAEFWDRVATGLGFDSNDDPRHVLRNFLLQNSLNYGAGTSSSRRGVTQELMYGWCISAWNAWRQNRGIRHLKATKGRPVVV